MIRRLKPRFLSLLLLIFGVVACNGSVYAPITAAQAKLAAMKTSLDVFQTDCGRYPSTAEGLDALLSRPQNITNWHGPYVGNEAGLTDPWKHRFGYVYPGVHNTNGYDLYSCGPDGVSKTGGGDPDDMDNWDPFSPHATDAYGYDRQPRLWLIPMGVVLVALIYGIARSCWRVGPSGSATKRMNARKWEGVCSLAWVSAVFPCSLLLRSIQEHGLPTWVLAVLPDALFAGLRHSPFADHVAIFLFFVGVALWWGFGLMLAVSGLRSGSRPGALAGSVAIVVFVLYWWPVYPLAGR